MNEWTDEYCASVVSNGLVSVATIQQELTGLAKMRREADAVEMLWLDDDEEELSEDGEVVVQPDSDGEPPELNLTLKEDGEKGSSGVAAAPVARKPVQEEQEEPTEARRAADTSTNGSGGGRGEAGEEVVEVA